jgi:predicted nucleotidyltransferase
MNRDRAIEDLRTLRPRLEACGIARAGLFGSIGRDAASANNDIDVVVPPSSDKRLDLVDLGSLQKVLEEGFAGLDVDVVVEPSRRAALKAAVERVVSTPFEHIARCFRDTVSAIRLIETWVEEAGGSDKAILLDPKARSAIERQLLIISEAAIRLDNRTQPQLLDWLQASTGPAFEAWRTSFDINMMISIHQSLSMSSTTD